MPPTDRPKPPYPYKTWIDCAIDHVALSLLPEWAALLIDNAARKELEELKEEVTELRVRRLSPTCKTCGKAMSLDCPSCRKLLVSDG